MKVSNTLRIKVLAFQVVVFCVAKFAIGASFAGALGSTADLTAGIFFLVAGCKYASHSDYIPTPVLVMGSTPDPMLDVWMEGYILSLVLSIIACIVT